MTFASILFADRGKHIEGTPREPEVFSDLNLNQIVTAVIAGKEEYDLAPFFHLPLPDVDAVLFRHQVMQDLEKASVLATIKSFAVSMQSVRSHIAQARKRYHRDQKSYGVLDAVSTYVGAVQRLSARLAKAELRSQGLNSFRDHLANYCAAEHFTNLAQRAEQLRTDLAAIRYCVFTQGLLVEVLPYNGESDYEGEIANTFARFEGGSVKSYSFEFGSSPDVNNVEGKILDRVANIHRELFDKVDAFCAEYESFQSARVVRFDREIQFYIAYLDYIASLKRAGLAFCYPDVSTDRQDVYARQSFDLALAGKLANEHAVPVCNDFQLAGPERIIVVTGPNQGGKTTFARMFGQLHYLASLGLPVPGTSAHLFLPDRLFAHFEREERMTNLRGKLQDDLARIHEILEAATPRSIVIINEIFASTTFRDALFLSRKIAASLIRLKLLCVWVTFIDEIASFGKETVSMVSTVLRDNPQMRTFKIARRPADGLAYAISLAEKYRLREGQIRDRIGP